MNLLDDAKVYLIREGVRRAANTIALAASSYLVAHHQLLADMGVTAKIDPNTLSLFLLGALEYARDWACHRYPAVAAMLD